MRRLGLFWFVMAAVRGQAPAFDVVSVRVAEPLPVGTAQVRSKPGTWVTL